MWSVFSRQYNSNTCLYISKKNCCCLCRTFLLLGSWLAMILECKSTSWLNLPLVSTNATKKQEWCPFFIKIIMHSPTLLSGIYEVSEVVMAMANDTFRDAKDYNCNESCHNPKEVPSNFCKWCVKQYRVHLIEKNLAFVVFCTLHYEWQPINIRSKY